MATSRDEFDWMLSAEIPHLRRYARSLMRDPTEADDLVQDCLERALSKWRLWRGKARLRSWLFRMLYRQFLNRRRDSRKDRAALSLDDVVAGPAEAARQTNQMQVRDVMVALTKLPDRQREAITLLAMEELSYEEAAYVLRIPVGTLRSRVSRGRETLRELTGEVVPEEGSEPTLRRVK